MISDLWGKNEKIGQLDIEEVCYKHLKQWIEMNTLSDKLIFLRNNN